MRIWVEDSNAFAPHLEQGFAFDRDTGDTDRYRLLEGGTSDGVDAGNTPSQRSFAYHYDTVSDEIYRSPAIAIVLAKSNLPSA